VSVLSHDCDGFWPTDDEQRRLEEIDKQLKMLLPAGDFELIASMTPTNETSTCQVRHCWLDTCHWDNHTCFQHVRTQQMLHVCLKWSYPIMQKLWKAFVKVRSGSRGGRGLPCAGFGYPCWNWAYPHPTRRLQCLVLSRLPLCSVTLTAGEKEQIFAILTIIIAYHLVHWLSASLPLKSGIPYLFTLGNHYHSPHSDAI